jgi:hypothetical protein
MQLYIPVYWHYYCDNSNDQPQKDFFLFLKFDYGYLNKSIRLPSCIYWLGLKWDI